MLVLVWAGACGAGAHAPDAGGHDGDSGAYRDAASPDAGPAGDGGAEGDAGTDGLAEWEGNCVIEPGSTCPDEAPICCDWVDDDGLAWWGRCVREAPQEDRKYWLCTEARDDCAFSDEPDCAPTDADTDGHFAAACGGDDCADDDPSVHPGALDAIEEDGWVVESTTSLVVSDLVLKVAVDEAGDEVLAYSTSEQEVPHVWVGRRASDEWETLLTHFGTVGNVDLVAGPGRSTAVAFTAAAKVWFARAPGWETVVVDHGGAQFALSSLLGLAVDDEDRAAVLVLHDGAAGLYRESEAGWDSTAPVDDAEVRRGADVAFGPDGSVHIAAILEGDLWHVTDESGAWTRELVDCTLGMRDPTIAIGLRGDVHIAYARWTLGEVWYASNASGMFQRERVARVGPFLFDPPALATGPDDVPQIVYLRALGDDFASWEDRGVFHARREVGGWSSTLLERNVFGAAIAVSDGGTSLVGVAHQASEPGPTSPIDLLTCASCARVDQSCDGLDGEDLDADGWPSVESGGEDCDDTSSAARPGVRGDELDGVDQNCSGIDGDDADADGYIAADFGGDDCNDDNPNVHPGAWDTIDDDRDYDCDGQPD